MIDAKVSELSLVISTSKGELHASGAYYFTVRLRKPSQYYWWGVQGVRQNQNICDCYIQESDWLAPAAQ